MENICILIFFTITLFLNISSPMGIANSAGMPNPIGMGSGMNGVSRGGMMPGDGGVLPIGNVIPNVVPNNEYKWQKVQIDPLEYRSDNINWQERKLIKQKTNDYYSKILKLIDDIEAIFHKFNKKIKPIESVYGDLQNEINSKIIQYGKKSIYDSIHLFNIFDELLNQWNELKKTNLYKLNKEFREKVDEFVFILDNISKMRSHYNESLIKFQNFISIVLSSLHNLVDLKNKINYYENLAWEKYEQLDEIINESQANNNYYVVINCFDNIALIDSYLRGEYLHFINSSMHELSASYDSLLVLFDNLIVNILKAQEGIHFSNQEIIDYENKEKEKIILEEQQKIIELQKIKVENEKKQLAAIALANQKSFYLKIIDQFIDTFKIGQEKFYLVVNYVKNRIFNIEFFKKLFGKKKDNNIKLKEKNQLSSNSEDRIVSDKVNQIVPSSNGIINIAEYSVPEGISSQKLSDIALLNQMDFGESGGKDSELENVFRDNKEYMPLYETNKIGAASYPVKVQPMINNSIVPGMVSNEQVSYGLDVNDANLIVNGNINSQGEQKDYNSIQTKESNTFKYIPLEKNDNITESKDNIPLLPDLSADMHVQRESQMAFGLGTSSGGNQGVFFEAQAGSTGGHSRQIKKKNKLSKGNKKNVNSKQNNKKEDNTDTVSS